MIRTQDITKSSFFIILLIVGAQITIPLPHVPFTLQLFTVALSSYILTKKQFLLTLSCYLIMGFLGLPIFSNFSSGLLKPTLGFLIGFIPFGIALRTSKILALIILYIIGLSLLILYFHFILQLDFTIPNIIVSYGLIFIPTDVIAIFSAQYISKRLHFLKGKTA